MKAFELARQWDDRIPIGLLFQQEKPSFTDLLPGLTDGPLVDRAYEPQQLRQLIAGL
jgi:2-oxoglutarate ferredoxin oxidoreductase subunit beta